MVQLALDTAVLVACAKNKIPVAARTAVVSPMGNCGIISEDGIESDVSLVLVAEIFCPGIDFFLPGRVPRHFAAEGIGFLDPAFGAPAHVAFEGIGLRLPALAFEVGQNPEKCPLSICP